MKTLLCKNVPVVSCSLMLALSLAVVECYAQVQREQPEAPTKVANLSEPGADGFAGDVGGATAGSPSHTPSASDVGPTAAITKELEAMKARVQQLEAQLETHPESPSPGSGIRNQKNTKKILKKGLTNWHIYVIT